MSLPARRLAILALALLIAAGGTLAVPTGSARAAAIPGTVSLAAEGVVVLGRPFDLDAWIPLSAGGPGTFEFSEVTRDGLVALATVPGDMDFRARLTIDDATRGVHTYRVDVPGNDLRDPASAQIDVDIEPAVATLDLWTTQAPVHPGQPIQVVATVHPHGATGTIDIRNADTSALLATLPIDSNDQVELDIPSLAAGTYHFVASYAGDTFRTAATSDVVELIVSTDTVESSGVKVDLTTFYPITDGYLDTVRAVGTLLEPASVNVVIYDSTGHVRKSYALSTRTGAYAVTWNGRNAAGTLLAAGKYKVVQTLTDVRGTKRVVTNYVNLSKRRLILKTTYVNKLGTSYAARGTVGGGRITKSSSGYVKMTGWTSSPGWAGVGWQFTLPSATFYKAITFQVYAWAPQGVPQNYLGLQDFRSCAYSASSAWNEGCFGRWQTLGSPTFTKWTSASGNATYNRSGRYVRGMVSVFGTAGIKVYKTRVKVTYGVWAS